MQAPYDIIVIGGSAGSIPVVSAILNGLTPEFKIPMIIVLHRQKNVQSEMTRIFQTKSSRIKVIEPEDKEAISPNHAYLAPQNYHLLIENNKTFSLDYSEPVHFSRPSIDVTFETVGLVFKQKALAILLSGANKDGTNGLEKIISYGGTAIVQDPSTAEYPVMVTSAISKCEPVTIFTPEQIVSFIRQIEKH